MAFLKVRILTATSLLMLATASAFAQSGPDHLEAIRSLESKIKEASSDSVKAKALIDLSDAYLYVSHAKAQISIRQVDQRFGYD